MKTFFTIFKAFLLRKNYAFFSSSKVTRIKWSSAKPCCAVLEKYSVRFSQKWCIKQAKLTTRLGEQSQDWLYQQSRPSRYKIICLNYPNSTLFLFLLLMGLCFVYYSYTKNKAKIQKFYFPSAVLKNITTKRKLLKLQKFCYR